MKIHLQYGSEGLHVDIPSNNVTVLAPRFMEGLLDEAAGFQQAVNNPINSKPLKALIKATDKVAVVIPDITRPLPTDRLLRWVFAELDHVPTGNFVIVNGTGSHRINTDTELAGMVGADIAKKYRIVNHNSHDLSTMLPAGKGADGQTVYMNKEYVQADRRIVMGFIEPHFMAGFSGGFKGIFPAVGDISSIMRYHNAETIGDPRSTWGLIEGNPTQKIVRSNGSLLPVDFCINVTQNRKRQIVKFFCGETRAAHDQGCAFSKATAMVACKQPFPIVLTTNSGYPLDQNLYQAVKGMSAAAQIVGAADGSREIPANDKDRGFILIASKCNDGFPTHGNFRTLLFDHKSPEDLLKTILTPGFSMYDQWEAQLLAIVRLKARVGLYSDIVPDEVRRAHLEHVADIAVRLDQELNRIGRDAPIAVLPEGPMTIPYLE